jgi:peptidoglycan/LPS O-acetylase OafA/YrhL
MAEASMRPRSRKPASSDLVRSRGIPSLDGIRALAILCVIWGHGVATLPQSNLVVQLRRFLPEGYFGVQIFFVLSGFLITTLLLREGAKTGRISLGGFYRRRAYRILPALYAFLLVVLALALFGLIDGIGWQDFLASGLFIRDYFDIDGTWWIGHTWSLSVEEQFYIIWPLLVILLPRRTAIRVLLIGVVASPFIRIATYLTPHGNLQIAQMFHTRADALMIGCLIAFMLGNERFEQIVQAAMRRHLGWIAIAWFPLSWFMTSMFSGVWLYTFGYLGDALAVGAVMIWMMNRPESAFGKFLNWKPIVHIGLISYSLYLWQQMFMTRHNQSVFGGLSVLGLLALLVCAELSYQVVEQPFLRLRVRRSQAAAKKKGTIPVQDPGPPDPAI